MKIRSLAFLAALFPVALFAGQPAAGSPANAIPTGAQSTTFVISKPGYYYLAGDRTMTDSSKNAVEIASADVTLDLGGYTIRYANISGTATAIHGKDVQNVEVRNGAITDTPWNGVELTATSGVNGIDNIRVVDVRVSAVGHFGIVVEGNACVVDRCTVDHSGNAGISSVNGSATVISNCAVSHPAGIGIVAWSTGVVVRNCTVSYAATAGISLSKGTAVDCSLSECNQSLNSLGAGILVYAGASSVKNCFLSNNHLQGILVYSGSHLLEGNTIAETHAAGGGIGGAAIYSNPTVIAVNNRYSSGTVLTASVGGSGNISF